MSKTPFELRMDLLALAKDQLHQRYYTQWEQAAKLVENTNEPNMLIEVPQFPTTEDILNEAEKFKSFIEKK